MRDLKIDMASCLTLSNTNWKWKYVTWNLTMKMYPYLVNNLCHVISDPHVSCISKPGGKISEILPLIHEAVEHFNVTTPPPHNPLYKGGWFLRTRPP